MSKKYQITENDLKNLITRYVNEALVSLNEEWGVSDIVIEKSNEIINRIKEEYESGSLNITHDKIGNECLCGTITDIKITETPFYIIFYIYDLGRTLNIVDNNVNYGASTRFSTKTITIRTNVKNGKFNYRSLNNSVYHEVEHIFQHIMSGKDLVSGKFKSNFNENAIFLMNRNSNNGWDKRLGTLMYITINEERDGILNGLYGELMELCDEFNEPEDVFHLTDTYGYYQFVLDAAENIGNSYHYYDIKRALIDCVKSHEWFERNSIRICNDFANDIERIFKKVKKDLNKKYKDTTSNVKPF